mgnify:CR=1 FL=1
MSKDYSLWAEAKTKHGLMADEVISGLQKSIRRSMTELACRYAYELYTTSPVLLEKLWSRLLTISVEDVRFGNLDAARHMYVLNQMAAMGAVPEIIDLALDKHTKRGKARGRDSKHFFNEACKVIPQAEVDNDYRERYGKILEEYDPSKVEEDAFQYAIGRV